MTYNQFISDVETGIRRNVKEKVTVNIHTVMKNNGKERQGITICEEGINISPTIYLEEYYEQYLQGEEFEQIVDDIIQLYKKVRFEKPWTGNELQNFESVKRNVVCKLINFDKNVEMLKDMPYEPFLDLAIVCYVIFDLNIHGTAIMTVKNEHLKMWNISREELIQLAKENSYRLLPAEFRKMKDIIAEMTGIDTKEDDDFMYVLSNEQKSYGAVCMIYKKMLDIVALELKENFYIIPSSVHEVIIIPESKSPEKSEIEKMVKEVNETQVEAEERLSDRVYYYNIKDRSLI